MSALKLRIFKIFHHGPRAFLISLLIHTIILFFIWSSQLKNPAEPPIEISIQNQLLPKKLQNIALSKESLKNKGSQSLGHKLLAKFSKPNLQSAFSAKAHDIVTMTDAEKYGAHPLEDNPTDEWGSGGATFARNKDYLLFRKVYETVDGLLYYPGVLARNRIEGFTHARLVLDSAGSCSWKLTQITGANPYLRLFVLDVLKHACHQNYSQFMNGRKLTNVDLSFKFAITEHDNLNLIEADKGIVGNTLLFYRNSHNSIMEWELGPFHGMFPIPVAYLNIFWLQENWDRVINHKEPLEVFKNELGHQI